MKHVLGLLFVFALAFGQTPSTLVTGTLTDSLGANFNGTLTIQWTLHRDADDNLVPAGSTSLSVSAGNVRVLLPPSLLTAISPNKTNFVYDVFGVNTVNGSVYAAKWVVPKSALSVSISSVSGGSGGGTGSGTVAGQTTNAVTVGGADATTVKGSGCTVGGGALDEMTCKKFNSTGDATQSGAIDLKGKTGLKYWSQQANDNAGTSVLEISPSAAPLAVGQVKRVKTRTTGQTVVYADGTDTNVTIAEMEYYTPPGAETYLSRNLGGTIWFADRWCNVVGTYDETCIANSFLAANPGDVIVLSQTFTINNQIVLSRPGLTFQGINGGGVIAKNGLNTAMFSCVSASACLATVFKEVKFEGNRSNQASNTSAFSLTNASVFSWIDNVFLNFKGPVITWTQTAAVTTQYGLCLLSGNYFKDSTEDSFKFTASGSGVGNITIRAIRETSINAWLGVGFTMNGAYTISGAKEVDAVNNYGALESGADIVNSLFVADIVSPQTASSFVFYNYMNAVNSNFGGNVSTGATCGSSCSFRTPPNGTYTQNIVSKIGACNGTTFTPLVSISQSAATTGCTVANNGTVVPWVALPDGTTNSVYVSLIVNNTIFGTSVLTVSLIGQNSVTGGAYKLTVSAVCDESISTSSSVPVFPADVTFGIANGGTGISTSFGQFFTASNVAIPTGCSSNNVLLRISRLGADAADTNTGDFRLYAVTTSYAAKVN